MVDLKDITILLPTRDEERNIERFLGSLPEEVHLVVVDSSRDRTLDRIRRLRPRNTRLLHQDVNVTTARQMGAQAAVTPWILFTDADVVFSPSYFRRLGTTHAPHALYGPKLSKDGAGWWYYRMLSHGQHLSDRLGIPAVSGSNLLVASDVFKAVGGFDLDLSCNEDSELGWRIRRKGFTIRFDPRLVVLATDHRRLHRGTMFKICHTLLRCAALYFQLLPRRLRRHDWGYWRHQARSAEN